MNVGHEDALAALRANELLTLLPDEELLRIAAVARPRRFLRNSALYAPGDLATELFVIVEGKVKLFYNTVDGDEVVLDVIRPGQQTGAVTVLDENPVHFLQATAVEPTRCFSILRDAFVAVVARQPMLTRRLLTGMRRRVHHDAQAAFLDVRARVGEQASESAYPARAGGANIASRTGWPGCCQQAQHQPRSSGVGGGRHRPSRSRLSFDPRSEAPGGGRPRETKTLRGNMTSRVRCRHGWLQRFVGIRQVRQPVARA
jgi:CRP-like cAMP-binding protein